MEKPRGCFQAASLTPRKPRSTIPHSMLPARHWPYETGPVSHLAIETPCVALGIPANQTAIYVSRAATGAALDPSRSPGLVSAQPARRSQKANTEIAHAARPNQGPTGRTMTMSPPKSPRKPGSRGDNPERKERWRGLSMVEKRGWWGAHTKLEPTPVCRSRAGHPHAFREGHITHPGTRGRNVKPGKPAWSKKGCERGRPPPQK